MQTAMPTKNTASVARLPMRSASSGTAMQPRQVPIDNRPVPNEASRTVSGAS